MYVTAFLYFSVNREGSRSFLEDGKRTSAHIFCQILALIEFMLKDHVCLLLLCMKLLLCDIVGAVNAKNMLRIGRSRLGQWADDMTSDKWTIFDICIWREYWLWLLESPTSRSNAL